jgi:hypothetical protein
MNPYHTVVCYLITILCLASFQGNVQAQTVWTVAQTIDSGWGNVLARVKYENSAFNFAWQNMDNSNAQLFYQVYGESSSPSLPFQLQITNSTMGGDPDSGSVKHLNIRYATNEGEFEASIREGDYLNIPDGGHAVVGPPIGEDTVLIVYARYETTNASRDVSPLIEDALLSSPHTTYNIQGFRFSSLSFEFDGTPMFAGSDRWGDRPLHAYDEFNHGVYSTKEFDGWSYWGGSSMATDIVDGEGVYVAGFSRNDDWYHDPIPYALATSVDLQSWNFSPLPQGYSVESIAYGDGRFIAVGAYRDPDDWSGSEYGAVFTSLTGLFWTVTILPSHGSLQDVEFIGSEWLVVGDNTSFWRTADGFSWEQIVPNDLAADLTAVAGGNGYVIVGTAGGVLYSTEDRAHFSEQARYSGRVNDIAVGDDSFMAAVGSYFLVSEFSPDGIADITSQPANSYTVPGERVTLSAQAVGDAPLSYQWFQGSSGDTSAPISGAISASFETPQLFQTERHWVRVQNSLGSEDSATATLTMQEMPVITGQPEGESLNMGDTISSRVSATGNNLSYQWYKGFAGDTTTPLSGRTGSYFGLRAELPGTFHYWVRVSNDIGSVESATVLVTVEPVPPVIVEQPQDKIVFVDGSSDRRLYVDAVGPSRSYQWYEGYAGDISSPVTSATSSSYYPSDDNVGEFYYWVRISNPAGFVDSRSVKYSVLPRLPVIVEQPLSDWIAEGESATLRVDVDHRSGTTYQWYKGHAGITTNPVSSTSSSLSLNSFSAGEHMYWVRVTNPDGFTDSVNATIHVSPSTFSSWLTKEGLPEDETGDGNPTLSVLDDGFPNLIRYLLGADSQEQIRNTERLSHGLIEVGDQVYFSLQFTELKGATDATLHIEESSDLLSWTETAVLISAVDNGDGTVTYIYRYSGIMGTDKGFLRLRASKP